MNLMITISITLLTVAYYIEVNGPIRKKQLAFLTLGVALVMGGTQYRMMTLYGFTYYYLMSLITIVFLTICGVKDMKDQEVPLIYLAGTAILGMLLLIYNPNITLLDSALGIALGGALLLFSWITKGALGQGDAWVMMVIGLLLGWQMAIALFLYGLFLSALWGGYLLIIRRQSRKTKVPFIPFLWGGALLIYLI